jgi:asparagine synthase (glutamine-hydrolysing)
VCSITGKVSAAGAVDAEPVGRMCATIEHCGPGSRGAFVDGGVGIGVPRLRVIDLGTGGQSVTNEDGTILLVLNGEIPRKKARATSRSSRQAS